MLSMLYLVLCK